MRSNLDKKGNKDLFTWEQKDGFTLVRQDGGPELGISDGASRARIIYIDGHAFKNFDGSGELKPYEDWRLPATERARHLASRLSIEEIAGLMLYSRQNKLPMPDDTYGGKPFAESGEKAWALSDGQRKFLVDDRVRHVLVSTVESPETAARWNNAVQALCENTAHGIPANNSSDPRHSAFEDAEFAPGASGQLSMWSNLMGLASTFSPSTVRRFAEIAAAEYRALGLTTALSPQADLGTDPRWYRFNATFGNDPTLVTDIVREYCEGLQGAEWGRRSVNAMVKHWPGGGSGEGGRDAHYGNGKYAVYPGGCFEVHKRPFVKGAFRLPGKTAWASAVMPYYTISYGQTSENVGNSFNRELIHDQLRGECGYEGVVCTDWIITGDPCDPGTHGAKPWGVEDLSVAERHYKALMAGVDQFGGEGEAGPVLDAYRLGCERLGEEKMRRRMEDSAVRLLLNIFRTGLFENPYTDPGETVRTVGNPEWMAEGYRQQVASVIMLKNAANVLPLSAGTKVYIPRRQVPAMRTYWGSTEAAKDYEPVSRELGSHYFEIVDGPSEADAAIFFMESPRSYRMGYDPEDKAAGGNGYIPITLQYRPYTAVAARPESIAGNRSYAGKSAVAQNECELDALEALQAKMDGKPVIVVMAMSNPTVLSEVEPLADALLVGFSVQVQAFMDLISGKAEPSGLLPFELPADMEAVEHHCEDRPHDIRPYTDSEGNTYSFAFGLDFSGPISDARTAKYGNPGRYE